jgi:type I restriction enzyme S subunit
MSTQPLDSLCSINPEVLGATTPMNFEFRYIDISAVTKGRIDWFATQLLKYANAPSRARRRLRSGDVLLCTVRPGLQAHAILRSDTEQPLVGSTGFAVLRPNLVGDSGFIFHSIFSDSVAAQLRALETGSNYPAVNERDVRSIRISCPEKDERWRISVVLDTVDEAIAKTEAVIAKLRQLRAGIVQALLTRGLDHNGQLRDPIIHPEQFKSCTFEFIPKDWRVVRLCDEANIQHGFAFDGRYFTDKPLGPRLLVPGNFHRHGGLYFTDENTKYYAGSYPPETMLSNGSMLIVMTDLSPMTLILGQTVLLNEPFTVLHNQRIGKFVLKKPTDWNPTFFVTMMNDDRVRRKVIREATGTTVRHTSPDRIMSGNLLRPPPAEQDEIVARIRQIDSSIIGATNDSAKLRCLKIGLMADLLTGRVRVSEASGEAL